MARGRGHGSGSLRKGELLFVDARHDPGRHRPPRRRNLGESEVEGCGFKLNDVYWQEFVPKSEWWAFVRHKERKFGRHCLEQWRTQQAQLLEGFAQSLLPFDEMLLDHSFLLEERPRFVDFDLYGMLGNFLYSGHYDLPAAHSRLKQWHGRMTRIRSVRSQ